MATVPARNSSTFVRIFQRWNADLRDYSSCEDFLQHRDKWRARGRLHSYAQVSKRGRKHRAPPYRNRTNAVFLEVRN